MNQDAQLPNRSILASLIGTRQDAAAWHTARSLWLLSETVVAVVAYCIILFPAKILRALSDGVWWLISQARLGTMLERWPAIAAIVSATCILLLASPIGPLTSSQTILSRLGATVLYLVLLSVVIKLGSFALQTPPSLPRVFEDYSENSVMAWFARRLSNPVDTIWLRPASVLSVLIIPALVGILFPTMLSAWTIALYGAVVLISLDAMNTLVHANSHYGFFRRIGSIK